MQFTYSLFMFITYIFAKLNSKENQAPISKHNVDGDITDNDVTDAYIQALRNKIQILVDRIKSLEIQIEESKRETTRHINNANRL